MINKTGETMEELLNRAHILSEALPYMRRLSGATVVIKYGGHAMEKPELSKLFAHDIVLLRQVGVNPVVVHGGGPQIKEMLDRLDVQSQFIDGLRVTDPLTMQVVEMVLSGTVNKEIVSAINQAGGFAVGLSGKDGKLVQAKKALRIKRDPETGEEKTIDLGLVGEPAAIDTHVLDFFRESDVTPVIAPVSSGPGGETLNINGDTVAGAIAGALASRRLMMLTDVDGVMDQDGKLIPELTVSQAKACMADGTITGGMIPKIKTCLEALSKGVQGAVIIDGRVPHAILLELFTEHGVGTLIRPD